MSYHAVVNNDTNNMHTFQYTVDLITTCVGKRSVKTVTWQHALYIDIECGLYALEIKLYCTHYFGQRPVCLHGRLLGALVGLCKWFISLR